MKKAVFYMNCQAALVHFLKKTKMAEHYEFCVYHNYQLILREQSPEAFMRDAAKADLFVFQPTGEIYGILGTDVLCADVVPKDALKLSCAYCFNTGFFPIVKHGRWWTGKSILREAQLGSTTLVQAFDRDTLFYDCAERFEDNLTEQMRREETCDIKLGEWIRQNYQTEHLFLLCNHPASALLVELARRILRAVNPAWDHEIPYYHTNEVQLPGHHAVHYATIRELKLFYRLPFSHVNIGSDFTYYRTLFEELQRTKGVL